MPFYISLGLSHSWESKDGDDWTVRVGGGLRRLLEVGGQDMRFQMQAFVYVARKPKINGVDAALTQVDQLSHLPAAVGPTTGSNSSRFEASVVRPM